MRLSLLALSILILTISCQKSPKYDTIIKHGMVYDGNGKAPFMADIGIKNDTIALLLEG
jgi:N-acyl-D-aspartate/D-glutamate deacylase